MRDTATPSIDSCLYDMAGVAPWINPCQYRYMSKLLPISEPLNLCCSPLTSRPLSAEQAETVAPLLKALADPVRLRLMSLIASHAEGEACVCDLTPAFELSQPTISHHLKVLHDAGLVDRERRGTWVYYRARPDALQALATLLTAAGATAVLT